MNLIPQAMGKQAVRPKSPIIVQNKKIRISKRWQAQKAADIIRSARMNQLFSHRLRNI
jgi:hypothetical protein